MQIPISEVRAKLPQLIKQLRQDPSVIYEITVHQAVVAELKAPPQLPQGGEAAASALGADRPAAAGAVPSPRARLRTGQGAPLHEAAGPHPMTCQEQGIDRVFCDTSFFMPVWITRMSTMDGHGP